MLETQVSEHLELRSIISLHQIAMTMMMTTTTITYENSKIVKLLGIVLNINRKDKNSQNSYMHTQYYPCKHTYTQHAYISH